MERKTCFAYNNAPRPDVGALIPRLPKMYFWASVCQGRDLSGAWVADCGNVVSKSTAGSNTPITSQ